LEKCYEKRFCGAKKIENRNDKSARKCEKYHKNVLWEKENVFM